MPGNDGDRPYFTFSIIQLESEFNRAQSTTEILQALDWELSHRKTDRATQLRSKVANALTTLPVGQTVPTLVHEPINGFQETPDTAESRSFEDSISQQPLLPATDPPPSAVPPIEDLGDLPSFPVPKGPNEPAAILAAWIALEALSPQTYRRPENLAAGNPRCVADLSAGRVPWATREPAGQNKKLYYQVILGSVLMERATEDLVKAFSNDEERSPRIREKAVVGAILVDSHGIVVEENGIAVSSFAWALPLALKLKLGVLGAWPTVEPKTIEKLDSIVRRFDPEGKPIPLDLPTIDRAYRWLIRQFGLPNHLVESPTFALRVYHYYRARNPPEVSLLNSFFLRDLARAAALVDQNAAPKALRRYLGIEHPKKISDLLNDKIALEKAIAPAMMPSARWPSDGGHPLVTLQQAAVNLVRSELAGSDGIIAVNGPPGTGKTTLLRDIVAACVLDRASAMTAFDDPEKAFTPSGQRMMAGENAFFHLYSLAPSLKGHEILVASSNNKAVENISTELPATKAIGRTTEELNYFKSISDLMHRSREAENNGEEKTAVNPVETWGLIAAVLGNAKNRAAFQQSFWWHDDLGFRLYLKAAKGDSVVREIEDASTGRIERRTPSVVAREKPPLPAQAKTNWRKAKARLLALKQEIDIEFKALEETRQLCLHLAGTRREVASAESKLAILEGQRISLTTIFNRQHADIESTKSSHGRYIADVQRHLRNRPGFFSRIFQTERWKAWSSTNEPLVAAEASAARALQSAEELCSNTETTLSSVTSDIRTAAEILATMRKQMAGLSQNVEAQRRILGDRMVDDHFFTRGHESSNIAAPWIPESLHRKREDLFIAAMNVHRAFIDASAQKILHNLNVLMDVFSSGPMQNEAKRKLLGDLWSTLFLVVPVISTTFASVDRMLGDLPAGSIGWLLIDEAGQALPQASVGAVFRAKRSVVVGDPLQIPPVVTLPERLNSEICNFFKIDRSTWAAPDASAQTLADQTSQFQAAFRSDQGLRRVGIPLLVHRRCQEPMFGISNRIAYDGQMVHAPGAHDTRISSILGPSNWLDIDGDAESKWCPAEGELVVELLRKIAAAECTDPDVFIITPFRIVAQEIKRRLEREIQLFSALGVDAREWANSRVGTIHTVQGREADTVILVLGAPKASQHGARAWAAGTPNILNVAVSRAKQNLYVVGSHGAWSGVGHARELASALPHIRV